MKIRVTKLINPADENRGIKVGDMFNVVDMLEDRGCYVKINGADYYMERHKYEVIEDEKFTVDMLEAGYKIIDRMDGIYTVITLHGYFAYMCDYYDVMGEMDKDFTQDLLDIGGDKKFDIVKVLDQNNKTIWIRNEEHQEVYIINGKKVKF